MRLEISRLSPVSACLTSLSGASSRSSTSSSSLAEAVYHSGLNYTTLGDSAVISPSWRLLAPLEGANGMLMFGVSTAMLFAIVQRLIHARLGEPSSWTDKSNKDVDQAKD